MTRHVGDWSNHDANRNGGNQLDYAAIARDGIAGGWHKTSDGLRFYRDPYWAGAIPRMRAAFSGGVYGSYHVLWGNRDIAGQCDWWASILDATAPGWRADHRFVLMTDNEPFGYNTAPSVAQINAAGDYLRSKTGKTMLAYAPPWVYGSALSGLRYPLVSSNYGANPVTGYRDAYAAAGGDASARWSAAATRVRVLQYGSRTIQGPHNTCDANAVRDADWSALVPTTTTEDDMTTGEMADRAAVALMTGASQWEAPEGTRMPNVVHAWRIRDEKWQSDITAQLARLAAAVGAPDTITLDAATLDGLADRVTDRLIAADTNGLTAADRAAVRAEVVSGVREVLRTGVGSAT